MTDIASPRHRRAARLRRLPAISLLAAPLAGATASPDPLTIPFDFSHSAIEMEVTVKGVPLHVILDTGVDPSVIDLAEAGKLGLAVDRGDGGEASGFGDGKGAAIFPVTVDGIAVGGRGFAPFPAVATDMGGISGGLGRKLDGVLGYSFLSDKIVLIDYPGAKLAFLGGVRDAGPLIRGCRARWTVPLRTVDSFPIIPGFRLGKAIAPVSFDTGSTGAVGLFQSALDLPGVRPALREAGTITRTGARGEAKSISYVFDAPVGFGPFSLPAGVKMSTYADTGSRDTRVANVGNRLLAAMNLKVLLDYRGKSMTFYGNCGRR